MSGDRGFDRARSAILESSAGDIAAQFVSEFPVDGAAVSVLSGPTLGLTVSASDSVAKRLDELQLDLGEGPCWSALKHRAPVAMDARARGTRWPAFTEAVAGDARTGNVGAVFAFPLAIGGLDIGAIDLYRSDPHPLTPQMTARVSSLAGVVAWRVLHTILRDATGDHEPQALGYSRREVHQATGMIIVQLDVAPEDAELLLRARAYADGRSVSDVARDVVARRLDLSTIETAP